MKYLLLSAALFIIPDFLPILSVPCLFIFLIPLWYQRRTFFDGFVYGFVWGLVTGSFKCFWFLVLIWTKSCNNHSFVLGLLLWIGTIVWLSLFSGLWLWSINAMVPLFQKKKLWSIATFSYLRIVTIFFVTIIYFYFLMSYSLFPYGVREGYPFFNPLLSLAYFPHILWSMKYIGLWGSLTCLIFFQLLMIELLKENDFYKRCRYLVGACFCLLPFMVGIFVYQPSCLRVPEMRYIVPWWSECRNPAFIGHHMAENIAHVVASFPHTRSILMPESTFCFEIDDYMSFISLWSKNAPGVTIMFGGHRKSSDAVINSFIIINDEKIVYFYDKQHFMPFVERSVTLFGLCACCNDILVPCLKDSPKVQADNNDLVDINGSIYQVFICSEFFFEAKAVKKYPIILIWNESWFCCHYMKNLALLFIKYFEMKHDVIILHASTQGKTNVG